MKLIVAILLFIPLVSNAANAAYLRIFLMQPKEVMLEKLNGVDDMDRYVKEVERGINTKISSLPEQQAWGFLVMAVREDGKVKAWLDTDDAVPTDVANAMLNVAQNTKAFTVKNGAAIFSLGFALDGADLPVDKRPFPTEWKDIAKCTNEDCAEKNVEEIVLKSW